MGDLFRAVLAALAVAAAIGCSKKPTREIPSREMCERMGDHVTNLIAEAAVADPTMFWDGLADTTVLESQGVTRDTFGDYLASDPGNAFLAERKADARAGMKEDIDRCARNGNKQQIECILAATDEPAFRACLK